jgi:hypothetical protein
VPVSSSDRKKLGFLAPSPFAPPVYRGVASLIPHPLLDVGAARLAAQAKVRLIDTREIQRGMIDQFSLTTNGITAERSRHLECG